MKASFIVGRELKNIFCICIPTHSHNNKTMRHRMRGYSCCSTAIANVILAHIFPKYASFFGSLLSFFEWDLLWSTLSIFFHAFFPLTFQQTTNDKNWIKTKLLMCANMPESSKFYIFKFSCTRCDLFANWMSFFSMCMCVGKRTHVFKIMCGH